MTLPDSAYLQFTSDLRICRVLNGLWQVSGTHGRIDPARGPYPICSAIMTLA